MALLPYRPATVPWKLAHNQADGHLQRGAPTRADLRGDLERVLCQFTPCGRVQFPFIRGLNGFSAGSGCARVPSRQLLLKPASDPFSQFRAMTFRERNERQSRLALFVVPADLSLSSDWQVGARQGE